LSVEGTPNFAVVGGVITAYIVVAIVVWDATRSALAQAPVNERSQTMNMEEIKEAVKNLSREDLGVFRKWFWEFDQERWDEEIEEDVKAGRFDSILREVDRDAHES
jgi:hypothetical protein